jgi:integrase
MEIGSEYAVKTGVSLSSACDPAAKDSTVCMATFIARKFIPDHVKFKTLAGRTHYQAILKHVLRPETVDRLFIPYAGMPKARLKAVPDWPYLDDVRLCDLTPDHVRRLTSSALAHGYSPQTVKHIKNVIGAIVSHAKRERIFEGENPISQVELPPIVRRASPNLSIAQAKSVLGMMEYPEREIALITFCTGMSISEICGLQWRRVNLSSRTLYSEGDLIPPRSISVRYQWSPTGLVDLSANRIRVLDIPDPLFRLLLSLRRGRKHPDPDHFILASDSGGPICPANIRMSKLKPIGRRLGMPWLSWQVLKRAHDGLLWELRIQLNNELAVCSR